MNFFSRDNSGAPDTKNLQRVKNRVILNCIIEVRKHGKGEDGMLFRLPIVRFFNRILNRITVTVVLVALQLAWLAWVFFALTTGAARVWVTGVLNGLSLLIILYLVRKDENSAYKVGWIALIGLLPLLGGALYLAFGNKRPSRRLRSKMQAVEQAHRADQIGRASCRERV